MEKLPTHARDALHALQAHNAILKLPLGLGQLNAGIL